MSRWRETLCGSAIYNPQSEVDLKEALASQSSHVLSSGGSFLPHIQSNPFSQTKSYRKTIFLPKTRPEIMLLEGNNQPKRFQPSNEKLFEDFDLNEDFLSHVESKLYKL